MSQPNEQYLTPAQIAARDKICELLSEHFLHWVLITEVEIDGGENDQATFWCGAFQGHSAAVGLMEKYKHRMLNPSPQEAP